MAFYQQECGGHHSRPDAHDGSVLRYPQASRATLKNMTGFDTRCWMNTYAMLVGELPLIAAVLRFRVCLVLQLDAEGTIFCISKN